jgi:glycosyltransferase involved in cell wall biosynthesis
VDAGFFRSIYGEVMSFFTPPIKLAFNGVTLLSPLTGIGQYTLRLAETFSTNSDIKASYFYGATWSAKIKSNVDPKAKNLMTWVRQHVPFSYELRQLAQTYRFRQGSLSKAFDLYHEPNNVLLPFNGPSVLTVHDLSWIRHPEMHPAKRVRAMNKYFEPGLRRATRIITDSMFVKRELIEVFGIEPDLIHAIPLAAEPLFRPMNAAQTLPVLQAKGLRHGSYWLAVGTLEPRKNLEIAIAAFVRLSFAERQSNPLILVGMKGWNTGPLVSIMESFIKSGQIRLLGYLSREDLAVVIAGARALIYPSIYEGFGLPPLEAMCCGVPVIASNASSLPEVVGNAGILIDPHDVDELTTQMKNLLENTSLRERLAQAALIRSQCFSWQQCAEQTVQVYRAALR